MLGAIIGDIVGSKYEFNNHRSKDFQLMDYKCFITDDTVMTLAIAKALLACHTDYFDLSSKTVECMQTLGRKYPNAGYGGGFYNWLFATNPRPYNSYGNGSAMRVSACGWVGNSIEEVKFLSKKVTEVTHNHPEGIKGAEATAVAIYLAKTGSNILEIRDYINRNYYPMNFRLEDIRLTYEFNETSQGTVPQAIEAFLESKSFEDAIRNAISIGGDSDTLAAITGSIAEAYYGIPTEIRKHALTYLDEDLLQILIEFENKYSPKMEKQSAAGSVAVKGKKKTLKTGERSSMIEEAMNKGGEDVVLEEVSSDVSVKTYQYLTTFKEIASINYSAVNRALRQFDVFRFNTLKSYFPNVKSTYNFVTNSNYLGDIKIKITSKHQIPPMSIIYKACVNVLSKIAVKVSAIEEVWEGTTEFKAHYLSEFIKDKSVNYTPIAGGKGMSQNDASVGANRLDLSVEDWFVFNDNYGTSEEKAFVRYFKDYVDTLRSKYDKIYLLRNERQIHLYSFEGGERFEPDYILYLCKNRTDSIEQLIVFVEPKGTHLIDSDKWKEDFLLELKGKSIPTITFADDNKYKIWGFHFFNTECRSVEFTADMETL